MKRFLLRMTLAAALLAGGAQVASAQCVTQCPGGSGPVQGLQAVTTVSQKPQVVDVTAAEYGLLLALIAITIVIKI